MRDEKKADAFPTSPGSPPTLIGSQNICTGPLARGSLYFGVGPFLPPALDVPPRVGALPERFQQTPP